MSLFRRKATPPPVDRRVVMDLIKLGMDETDAADRDIDSPDFTTARDRFNAALGKASQAEKNAAIDALRRHGY